MNIPKPKRKTDRELLNTVKALPCAVCGRPGCDPAHIKSVGAGGPDAEFNVIPLCRRHHTEQHKVGWIGFLENYPPLLMKFKSMGWEFGQHARPWHPKLKHG